MKGQKACLTPTVARQSSSRTPPEVRLMSAQKYVVGIRLKLTPATYSTHVTLRLTAEEHLKLRNRAPIR